MIKTDENLTFIVSRRLPILIQISFHPVFLNKRSANSW